MASKQEKREMIIKRDDTTLDRILAHHKNPDAFELSASDEMQLERWREIFALLLRGYTKTEIVNMWVKKGISMSQSYVDIRNTEVIFGDVMKSNKDFDKALFIAEVKDFIRRCKQKGDRKGESKGYDLLGKYSEFNKVDDAQFNAEKLANIKTELALDPKQERALEQFRNKGVSNFNDLNVIDIDHVDVKEGGDGS